MNCTDFDGNDQNLVFGFDPILENQDGGPGSFFGVGNLGNWPQQPIAGPPFGIIDETLTNFPPDLEAIWSDLVSDPNNNFFCISDTQPFTEFGPVGAEWGFDISQSAGPLRLSIDMGQQSDGSNFGFDNGFVEFFYSLDGGPFQPALMCVPDFNPVNFNYLPMDNGNVPQAGPVCVAQSPFPIVKIEALDLLPSPNLYLNKCPPLDFPNQGTLDTFHIELPGKGNFIQIFMVADINFEALCFDNLKISAPFVAGDADGNGVLDFRDIEPFVLALFDPLAFAELYPNVDPEVVLDINKDCVLDFNDIEPFVALLFN